MVRTIIYIIVLFAFAACGGSSSTPTTNGTGNSNAGKVAVVVTDNLTTDYSEVWVTLFSIEASDGANSITLYDNPAGEVINLAELNGVGSLLSVMDIPAGTYTSFEIKLDRNVSLVTNTGVTEVHQIASSGDSATVSFEITGELVVADGAITTFTVDFDLSQFTLNESGQIIPVMKQVKDMTDKVKQTQTKIHGEVVSLTDTGFVLLTKDGAEVTVAIDDYTILLLEDGLTLSELMPGMKVKVFGSVDTETLVINATKVVIDSPDSDSDASTVELEGTITAVDTAAGTITVDVKHAEFMPESNTVTISISETTHFCRGTADILAEGQVVEVKGIMQADGTISATSLEIEGAGHDGEASHAYAEIKGSVVMLEGTSLSVLISHVDGLDVAVGSEITIDISDAFLKDGTIEDLIVDVMVEVKGTIDDTGTFKPTMVEINIPTEAMSSTMPDPMTGPMSTPAPVM